MSGAGEAYKIGPFTGGLNLVSDPSAVDDNELTACVNMELDLDGSLVSRPAFRTWGTPEGEGSWTGRIKLLGTFNLPTGKVIIGSSTEGTYWFNSHEWYGLTDSFAAAAAVQYMNKIWLISPPTSSSPGGYWDGEDFYEVSDMPHGLAARVFKERLFICPGISAPEHESRLYFSDAGDLETWPAENFIDVTPGDGQCLVDLAIYRSNLLLFKSDSTYVLSYDAGVTDAVRETVNPNIGASSQHCVVEYEGSVFVYHDADVYELVNYVFTPINTKVPFVLDTYVPEGSRTEEVFMSLLGNRLVVRYYNKIYVYGLRTRTWSEWKSAAPHLHNFGVIVPYPENDSALYARNTQYFAGSCVSTNPEIFQFWDTVTEYGEVDGDSYDIECYIRTKNYDMQVSHAYKRLFWWGADIITGRDITGIASPVVNATPLLWGDVYEQGMTCDDLGSWDNPIDTGVAVTVTRQGTSVVARSFVQFLKALRFRQINFGVKLVTAGTSGDGPARLYTLTARAEVRQKVGKAVT